ncbi:AsmA family protein [Oceanicoccus sagamiensis]|uniref:AsmA domain-containing protein n=1 Tax=Oceanicoccus sagamiensis TaxID=716816 RepID=A0A1X9NDM5_9GAMM|nr:AsmA family protein [Oceanicoccus sagamiensis]ARN76148.1 hypothetical protein BST96_19820 [Oceanicoccus sagamiensis]
MKLLKVLAVMVLIIAAGIFYVANNINGIVQEAVVKVGSKALKTSVTLAAVDIQLLSSRAELTGLVIANPQGFKAPNLFEMDTIVVDLDIMSMLDNVVNVQEITIDGARVTAEQKGTSTNVQALLKGLDSGSSAAAPAPAPAPEAGDSAADDILIKVGQFNFINSATQLVTEQWGETAVKLPAIRVANIGGEAGVPPEALAGAIVRPLLKQLNQALKDRLQDLLEDEAKAQAKAKLKEKEDELKNKLDKKLEQELGDDKDDTVDAIKSLFSK